MSCLRQDRAHGRGAPRRSTIPSISRMTSNDLPIRSPTFGIHRVETVNDTLHPNRMDTCNCLCTAWIPWIEARMDDEPPHVQFKTSSIAAIRELRPDVPVPREVPVDRQAARQSRIPRRGFDWRAHGTSAYSDVHALFVLWWSPPIIQYFTLSFIWILMYPAVAARSRSSRTGGACTAAALLASGEAPLPRLPPPLTRAPCPPPPSLLPPPPDPPRTILGR